MSAADDYPSQDELEDLARQYMNENPEMYDTADLEALGAAVYVEETPQEDARAFADIAEYIFHADNFHEQRFKFYKEAMGGDRFDEDIVERVSDVVDEVNGESGMVDAYRTLWEALYREKVEDLDEADEVIEGMLEEISNLEDGGTGNIFVGGNFNSGNQVLEERPPNNWNMGNQVVLEDFETSGLDETPDEISQYWRDLDKTNPDQFL